MSETGITPAPTKAATGTGARPVAHRRRLRATWVAILLILTIPAGLKSVGAHYRLAYDGQTSRCLEGYLYLIALDDHAVTRGDFLAFTPPEAVAAHYGQPLAFLKRVQGLAGDEVMVTTEATTVNGRVVARGLALAETLGTAPEDYHRRFTVPKGHLFLLGDTADSYDGRYWGTLPAARSLGRAHWLL